MKKIVLPVLVVLLGSGCGAAKYRQGEWATLDRIGSWCGVPDGTVVYQGTDADGHHDVYNIGVGEGGYLLDPSSPGWTVRIDTGSGKMRVLTGPACTRTPR